MEFHNVSPAVYHVRMAFASARPFLARLRSSTRLAALFLLVFALKFGTAAACAKHDFADLGLGAGDNAAWAMEAVSTGSDGSGDLPGTALDHAGACSHSHSHHAAAILPESYSALLVLPQNIASHLAGLPPSTSLRLELRPPIA